MRVISAARNLDTFSSIRSRQIRVRAGLDSRTLCVFVAQSLWHVKQYGVSFQNECELVLMQGFPSSIISMIRYGDNDQRHDEDRRRDREAIDDEVSGMFAIPE